MTEFGWAYSAAYDLMYRDKDYDAECDLLEHCFTSYGQGSISSVVDLGCGTGNHSVRLAQRGYEVVGVDRSKDMLKIAREKARSLLRPPQFVQGDLATVDLRRQFDAAAMLFAVLSYQISNENVIAALRNARRRLAAGGLLILDVWNGNAVLSQGAAPAFRELHHEGKTLLRFSRATVQPTSHTCEVAINVWEIRGDRLAGSTEERHVVRYFFPQELTLLLDVAGFTPVHVGAFPDMERPPSVDAWNMMCVAKAR